MSPIQIVNTHDSNLVNSATWAQKAIKLFNIINPVEHKINPANKYQNTNTFNIFPADRS